MATISDNYDDVPDPDNPDRLFKVPAVLKAQDYYPFGMEMPGRTYSANDEYRFGFNGKEADKNGEWGGLTHYDYGFRIYNPAVARFLSVDPLSPNYPYWTPYQFASNSPIANIDLDGLESKIAYKQKIEYKPVFSEDAGSTLERIGNSIHNAMTLTSNALIIEPQNAGIGLWNFGVDLFAGEYNDVKATDIMVGPGQGITEVINNSVEYHLETPISEQLADAAEDATNLKNYEAVLSFYAFGGKQVVDDVAKIAGKRAAAKAKNIPTTFQDAIDLRDAINKALIEDAKNKSALNKIVGVVVARNKKTGQIDYGLKFEGCVGCAEDIVYKKLVDDMGGNPEDIQFTKMYRPNTKSGNL